MGRTVPFGRACLERFAPVNRGRLIGRELGRTRSRKGCIVLVRWLFVKMMVWMVVGVHCVCKADGVQSGQIV